MLLQFSICIVCFKLPTCSWHTRGMSLWLVAGMHSRPQSPWSIWTVPRIETSGLLQTGSSQFMDSLPNLTLGWKLENSQKLGLARCLDPWYSTNGLQAVGMRMAATIWQMNMMYNVHSHIKKCSSPGLVAATLFPENADLTVLMINYNYI